MQPAADFCTEINHSLGPQLQVEIDRWKAQLVWQEALGDPERLRPLLEQSIVEARSNGDNAQLAQPGCIAASMPSRWKTGPLSLPPLKN